MRNFKALIINGFICLLIQSAGFARNDKSELAQLELLGNHIESTLENGNPVYLNNLFDMDCLMAKIVPEKEITEANRFLVEGFLKGFRENFDFGNIIINELNNNGSYEFLRAYFKEDAMCLLFRLFSDNGINYHELEVEKEADQFIITDVYLFLAGERISETVARIYSTFKIMNRNCNNVSLRDLKLYTDFNRIKSSISKGNYKYAYKSWQKLDDIQKTDNLIQVTSMNIASHINAKTYLKTYREYVIRFPNTSGKYLIPFEGFVLNRNYPMALECIDSLDKSIKKDPMLNYIRATLLYAMGENYKAAKCLDVLIESIPGFKNGYLSLLGLYIEDKKYADATRILDKMMMAFNYYKDDLHPLLIEFTDFINSSEYKSWSSR